MFGSWIQFAVRRRGVITALTLIVLIYGSYLVMRGRLDVFPEFVPPQVTIQAEAPGLAPDQVEALVTRPIEQALSGVPGTQRLTSESIAGLSVVNLIFNEDADIYVARQGVAERLAELIGTLPAGVHPPRMSPLVSSTMDLLKIGLASDRVSPRELRTIADWELRPRLLAVPGVARITVYGGEQRQVQIMPDPLRLIAADVSMEELELAGQAALGLRGTGYLDLPAQRLSLATSLTGDPVRLLRDTVVATRGDTQVRIKDVAQVAEGAAIPFGDAMMQGRPGILLSISSQYGANTLDATRAVEAVLDSLAPRLEQQGIKIYPALHRPASFIQTALRNLRNALLLGAGMIALVLVAFLRDTRSTVISFLAIPLSLLTAIIVLERFGLTLNTLTLGGFAVALGVLVDDAIIYLENILRRLRQNALLPDPAPRLAVVAAASREISGAVVFATAVILLVFLPVFLLPGVQGRFMAPLALAFSLSVLASLLVAVTVTPALAALLLRVRPELSEPRWLVATRRAHTRALEWAMARPRALLGGLAFAFIVALGITPFLAGEFMPSFREGHFVAQISSRVPGTSFQEMKSLGARVSHDLLALPFVATAALQLGRAEQGEDTWGPERGEFHIELRANAPISQDRAQEQIRAVMERYPSLQSEVLTFLGDRISESFSGETAQGVVQIFGDDLDAIDSAARRVAQLIAPVPGIADVQLGRSGSSAELAVNLLPARLAQFGLGAGSALDALQSAFAGRVVQQIYDQNQQIDVVLLLPPEQRRSIDAVASLPLRTPGGQVITIGDVARIYLADARTAIRHQDGQRFAAVTFNAGSRGIGPVATDVQARLQRDLKLPKGSWYELGGEAAAQRAARHDLLLYTGIALALIVLVLILAFERSFLSAFVMLNLPFGLIGAIVALAVTGQSLSLGALVGLVTVFGISARNAILLLSHYEHLARERGATRWSVELLVQGAAERLLPVTMTAAVTALGLLPLALATGRAGNEIESPLAIAVLGGLVSSTVLSIVALPAFVKGVLESRYAALLETRTGE